VTSAPVPPSGLNALPANIMKRGEERSRRFGRAMDAIVDAIYLVDRSGMRFVHVNDAACRMQNRTREQLLALEPGAILGISRADLERRYLARAPPLTAPHRFAKSLGRIA